MNEVAVEMPDRNTMFDALCGVLDENHAKEKLFPKICNNLAGTEKVASGVVLGLQLAIHDYVEGMPPIMANVVNMNMTNFIEAITPEEIRQETLDFWDSVTSATVT